MKKSLEIQEMAKVAKKLIVENCAIMAKRPE